MKWYGVFSIVRKTGKITFDAYYDEEWYEQYGYEERETLDGKFDKSDGSHWVFVEVDDENV